MNFFSLTLLPDPWCLKFCTFERNRPSDLASHKGDNTSFLKYRSDSQSYYNHMKKCCNCINANAIWLTTFWHLIFGISVQDLMAAIDMQFDGFYLLMALAQTVGSTHRSCFSHSILFSVARMRQSHQ